MRLSGYSFEWPNLLSDLCSYLILCDIHVVAGLEVQPKARALSEVTAQSQSQLCCNRPLSINYIADAHWRNTEVLCKSIPGEVKFFQ
jgi:hypothetical protein